MLLLCENKDAINVSIIQVLSHLGGFSNVAKEQMVHNRICFACERQNCSLFGQNIWLLYILWTPDPVRLGTFTDLYNGVPNTFQ